MFDPIACQKLIKRRDLRSRGTLCAVGEKNTLFCARERYEEPSCAVNLILGEAPPGTIVQSDEDDGMVLKAFTLANRHQRDGTCGIAAIRTIT
nr:hypothetical protein [Cupriavidus metallidurans]